MSNHKQITEAETAEMSSQKFTNEASKTDPSILGKRSKHDSSVDLRKVSLDLSEESSDDSQNVDKKDKR
jgi:hypothetical protein